METKATLKVGQNKNKVCSMYSKTECTPLDTIIIIIIIIIIIMIIIIIIAIQRRYSEIFYNLLTAPRTVSNTYAQVARRNRV